MSQLGLSLGAGIAPAFAVYFSYRYSWHWAFYAAGLLSLAWIPMWLATARFHRPSGSHRCRHEPRIRSVCCAIRVFGRSSIANTLGMARL